MNHYNKLISVLYFDDERLGFIGNSVEMLNQIIRKKKISKVGEIDILFTEDIKRLIKMYAPMIKKLISDS